ncbi:hypothetical protein, partial [Maribacter sp.]|uniref:hypothetical protein n=1 Tax=Maribacter sp. TaxID=1897614 RepID=UPI0025C07EAB
MTKKEFLELAKKYQQGECSEREQKILFSFCDKAQFKDLLSSWSVSKEEQTRIDVLRRIRLTIRSSEKQSTRKSNYSRKRAFAAVVIGLIVTSCFYMQYSSNTKTVRPINAITLELEDGSIEIINE